MKRQTILLNSNYAWSLIRFRQRMIQTLTSAGHTVVVTAPAIDSTMVRRLERLGAIAVEVPMARTGFGILSDLKYFLELRKVVYNHDVDKVVNYTIKPNIWGSFAAWSTGRQSFSMITGLGFAFIPGKGIVRFIAQKLSHMLLRFATTMNKAVIFQNSDDVSDFIAAGCLGRHDKVRMINGSGVDLIEFARVPLPDAAVFIMVARFLVTKGLREFVESAIDIKRDRPDIRFLLVGETWDGPDAISVEESSRWGQQGIEMLGQLDDVRPAIAEASVFVLPSWREGTPRSVLEAMAMGRAIITTDVPGCRETVEQGVNGLLVPPRDAEALKAGMLKLADDRPQRERMGANSVRLARERFDVELVNHTLFRHLGIELSAAKEG